jgi:outer membrane protein OmpA-like peptidoglycan-associated protein
MKTVMRGVIALLVAGCTAGYALDHDPLSAGTTDNRNQIGSACEAPFFNPALLGVDRVPRGGILAFPFTDYGVGAWSDKLALSPFNKYWVDSTREMSALLTKILETSFNIPSAPRNLSDSAAVSAYADNASKKLTDGLAGGVTAFAGYRMTLLNIANQRFAFDITTHVEEEMHIPEGPLYAIFSGTGGLLKGNTLDFSNFRQNGLWATDFTFDLGLPVSIPALSNFFKLRYGAGGIGVKYIMGHSVLQSTMKDGTLSYNNNPSSPNYNKLSLNGELTLQTAGTGLHGPFEVENPFGSKGFHLPINGHGIGTDIGGILYDDNGTLSLGFQNVGVIFWIKDVKEVTYKIHKDDLDAFEIIDGIDQKGHGDKALNYIFNRAENQYISDASDSLKVSSGFTTVLPVTFSLGYTRSWDYSIKRYFVDYCHLGANYEQALTRGPGRSYIPRLSIGGEAGMLYGYIPLRMGFAFGGAELIASALGGSFNFRYFSINLSYKAMGTMYFWPKRGMEVAAGMGFNWGYGMDRDHDGIIDKLDKCPTIPEDRDGFQDEDGCPDYDNDNDGIPDSLDKCPNVPEDKDGFQDQDGCPDYDNDNDGIPDSLDKCPNVPEDKDGFQDADGCPDYDNDADGIPDSLDKCPNIPEDIDGFEDADGCPDYDNDKDGIPDSVDRCPMVPEVFNGYKDEDGCPDTVPTPIVAKPTVKEMQVLNTKLRDINFKTASAELLPASYAALDYVTSFLRQYSQLKYEIQGHCDSRGDEDYNLLLSAARAGTVRAYLLSKGIADSTLIGIGYGKARPIADNKTAAGRALNRRVEFHFIETPADYSALKVQEQMFRERIRAAKIQGAQY